MFYIKTRKPNGKVVKTEITDGNVFTLCPGCGRETPVSLPEILTDGVDALFSADIICAGCRVAKTKAHLEARIKVPLTYDGISWMVDVLEHSGHSQDLVRLYHMFDIGAPADLDPCDYAEFGKAIAKMVDGEDEADGYEKRRGLS